MNDVMLTKQNESCPQTSILPQPSDVARKRDSEEAAVFTTELRCTQVSDTLTGSSRVHHRCEHKATRLLQPQNLLILQRAHRGDCLEVLMERRDAHVHHLGQLFHLHRL